MKNNYFGKFYTRLAKEGFIKSLISGVIIGVLAMFVSSLTIWITGESHLWWISLPICAVCVIIFTSVLYFLKYRPTKQKVAQRIDSAGLEERAVTMLELENESSIMATKQKEDTEEHLQKTNPKSIKLLFSKLSIALALIFSFIGVGVTTYTALSDNEIVPTYNEVISVIEEPFIEENSTYYEVVYITDGGGYIDGEEIQIVPQGGSASTVTAVAEDGWIFVGWMEDNYQEASRTDTNVQAPLTYTAMFQEVEYGGDGDSSDSPDVPQENNTPDDVPKDSNSSDSDDNQENTGFGDDLGNGAGNGDGLENDQVVNGETDYTDVYEYYLQLYEEYTERGEEVPQEILEFLEKYYGIL